ncbi:tight adherence protein C [Rhodobium orientis]|uniref:Type II secretion system protein n=1 Tax=Rhodobium orientis TaxID=34017 RepID=A0A327JS55_9HYPH|nr:type II secretion system F family protein [Rhodobium orientis]MBB4304656.1 tight adherence protein C [Rhodobium orientis]MBK5950031.1 type II secretion system protein [Rhodobium orientis]RAI27722.1 type II secretion system protein [Rhodobium orientis]
MFQTLTQLIADPQILLMVFTVIAVSATIMTVALPMLQRDELKSRMRNVATEREAMRARERARLQQSKAEQVNLRPQPKDYMQRVVNKFNLRELLIDENTVNRLKMAGFRGQAPLVMFLFARFVAPIALFVIALLYMFLVLPSGQPVMIKVLIASVIAAVGFYAPALYVSNVTSKRQLSIRRAWPDALDLMLICVESGMSIEAAFRKVGGEIGESSIPLAEELTLTTAELSYLQDRRQAYENLAGRTGLEGVKSVTTALLQSERYGTPLSQSLRVMADENREMRITEAEKRAAALPPKLTVPMIVFFLPVLFAVIMGPAIIQIVNR